MQEPAGSSAWLSKVIGRNPGAGMNTPVASYLQVYVTLYGSKGDTGEVRLDASVADPRWASRRTPPAPSEASAGHLLTAPLLHDSSSMHYSSHRSAKSKLSNRLRSIRTLLKDAARAIRNPDTAAPAKAASKEPAAAAGASIMQATAAQADQSGGCGAACAATQAGPKHNLIFQDLLLETDPLTVFLRTQCELTGAHADGHTVQSHCMSCCHSSPLVQKAAAKAPVCLPPLCT
eukprot:365095-Chlamydomonas_euryale.AAC.9